MAMLFSFYNTNAQIADTLKETKVKGIEAQRSTDERLNTYAPGQNVVSIDSVTLEQYKFTSIANLLSQQVPVFVKSYGLNNIATLNFRGASAAQSQVYWNGIPIQNAALGVADVSILPVELMNKVNVVYGSSSALWGSGNVGGALMVENSLRPFGDTISNRYSASAVTGSFGHYRFGANLSTSTPRLVLDVRSFFQTVKNNFPYRDEQGVNHTMYNANLNNGTAFMQAAYKVNNKNVLAVKGWYQLYNREIPPAIFETTSAKKQKDESVRLLLDWKRTGTKTNYYAKTSYIRDFMHYEDSVVLVDNQNVTHQVYSEAGVQHRFSKNHQLLLFTPIQIAWIDRVLLNDTKTQNRYALAFAYLYTGLNEKLKISLNGRGEIINDLSVFLPGINTSYTICDWLKLRANVQKTYRVPTLNELYYSPGGNTRLKPESGWNQDVGYSVRKRGRLNIEHSLSFYNREIDNWIIWFGGAIWTPHNIATVHSRGLQTENSLRYRVNKSLLFKLGVNASYTLATTQSSYITNDGSIGKQIPYTPRYQAQANLGIKWKRIYFNYNQTYTGIRFITTDESFYLPEYTLGNVQLLYTVHLMNHQVQLSGQCNNIWKTDYYVVNARPMPFINWLLGVSLSL